MNWGSLIKLEYLMLSVNELRGEIPRELANLTNLLELELYDNSLAGEIPSGVCNLPNLYNFAVWGNGNIGDIPDKFRDRDRLVALYLETEGVVWFNNGLWLTSEPLEYWNGIYTSTPHCRVTSILLAKNWLHGEIPSELGGFTFLENLNLSGNHLFVSIPSELGNLTALEQLDLSDNALYGEIPPSLGEPRRDVRTEPWSKSIDR